VTDLAAATPRYAAKKEAILAAATADLNARGAKGMTLAGVAGRVGLITSSVTYYFRKKEDLAVAVLLRGVETLDGLAAAAGEAPTAEARVFRFLDLYLDLNRRMRMGEACPLPWFNEIPALKPAQREPATEAFAAMFRRVRSLFSGPEFEGLSRLDRNARTHLLLEQAFWTRGWLHRYDVEDYGRVRDRMFDILVNGLAAPGRTWAPGPAPAAPVGDPAREEFLKAASRLMNQRGYRGASVEDISAELNVTKGSFYHHLDAKDDLVEACVRRSLDALRTVQMTVRAGPGTAWDKLTTAVAALVALQVSDYGPLLRNSVLSSLPPDLERSLADQYATLNLRSASLVADGVVDGSLRPVDPMIAAQMIAATLSGGATLPLWAPGVTVEAAPEAFARPLFVGVLQP
jgi:AcrR family transcriptional regulator